MRQLTFKGGVHPCCNKLTEKNPIRAIPLPTELVIPLQQHLGAPAEAKVKAGDLVKKGQIIGDSTAFVFAPIHATTSGKVKAVEARSHPALGMGMAVIIEADGEDTWFEVTAERSWQDKSPDELKKIIRQAGIVGMGGAAFPTHVKLSPPPDKPIKTIIINGAECEPYLTADARVMLEYPDEIITGLEIVMYILKAEEGYIGIEDNKPEEAKIIQEALAKKANNKIKIVTLPVKYPQGGEKQLIKSILDKEVPSGGLPLDIGVVVQNVGTSAAISRAVTKNEPLIERVLTVSGSSVNTPDNLLVRIGTLFSYVFDQCGGLKDNVGKIIMGGPMMGMAQKDASVPVIKGTSGILALSKEEAIPQKRYNCIRCGMCLNACPVGLNPTTLANYIDYGRIEEAKIHGLFDCIECGCCTYACPAKRPIVQTMKLGKYLAKSKG